MCKNPAKDRRPRAALVPPLRGMVWWGAMLPGLNTGMFYASGSPFMGKLGKKVASPKFSLYDEGATPGLVGSKGITCEGLPTGRTDLIRDGVIASLPLGILWPRQHVRDRDVVGVEPFHTRRDQVDDRLDLAGREMRPARLLDQRH